jgi:integrase
MLEIIAKRLKEVPDGCPFLFHHKGKPLRYNRINVAFNDAWKLSGLSGKFSGSHLLRYSSAQSARRLTGSLDAAASVTGHQSMVMAAHYGKLDSVALNQSSVVQMEKHMNELLLIQGAKAA